MPHVTLVLLAIVALTALIVAHVALAVSLNGVTEITTLERWIALLPLANLYLARKYRKAWPALVWACLIVLYGALYLALTMR